MRPIVTPAEMAAMEQASGVAPDILMERAGTHIATHVHTATPAAPVLLLVGKGNNGGDALVAGRKLLQHGHKVHAWIIGEIASATAAQQKERFVTAGGTLDNELVAGMTVIDGLFGTGFQGTVDGDFREAIERVNSTHCHVVSIDIPSGLNGDTGAVNPVAIHATTTLAIQYPKRGLYLQQGWDYAGEVICVDIGLSTSSPPPLQLIEESDVASLLPRCVRTRHKYLAGDVVGLAGSPGMCGAAMLAAHAALRAGAGICHLLHPDNISQELQGQPWEVVRVPYKPDDLAAVRERIDKANACFIGPGLGTSADAILSALWDAYKGKSVIDADAINWIAKRRIGGIGPMPGSIFTPHVGEMSRLLNMATPPAMTMAFLDKCREFVEAHHTNLLLKGGPTYLFTAGKSIAVMPKGSPGMATAGSGDVLTGMVSGLMAQGVTPPNAMLLGSYLHGLAGELAAQQETPYCLTASTLLAYLPQAFSKLLSAG